MNCHYLYRSLSLGGLVLMFACSDKVEPKERPNGRVQRDQTSQTMALDLTSQSAVTTLYPLGMPDTPRRSVSAVALGGEATAVRIYAVARGLLPAQADALALYDHPGPGAAVNPAAAAILAEPSTRLIFYARRPSLSLRFPVGWGLPLGNDETLVVEVEWTAVGAHRHIQVDYVEQQLKPLTAWVAETANRGTLDAPAHVSATTSIPAGQQIFWVSLIASPSLAPQKLKLNGVAVPMQFGTTELHDFFVPAAGKVPAAHQPVELVCATRSATDSSASADCGVFGYYYQP